MRKLILKMNVSLEGILGEPNGESAWIFETRDEACKAWELETIWQAGLHVLGRKSFETMASYWPSSSNPYAAAMNSIPKLVFTRSGRVDFDSIPPSSPGHLAQDTMRSQQLWRNPLIATDLVAEITRQKQQEAKPIIAYGGASFARELIKYDLVDEYHFLIHPIALGKGLAIFDTLENPRAMKLVSSSAFRGGATAQVFRRER